MPTAIDPDTLDDLRNEMDEDDNKILVSHLERDPDTGDIELFVQVSNEVEQFFESEETSESEEWHGSDHHEFYHRDYAADLADFLEERRDNYGGEYIEGSGAVNIGLLRTVGISDGRVFKIENTYSEETLEESVRDLKEVVKELYRTFITPVAIRGTLHIEEL